MSSIHAYCSWCFEKTIHRLVEQNYLRRNVYECTSDRCVKMNKTEEDQSYKKTVQCRFCQNMAKTGKYWDDRLCAEHSGLIASFEKLNTKLEDITDYRKIFERDSWNIKKIATTGFFVIAGTAIAGPIAFAAAPAIGGTIGVVFGYSGAVATNVGLATLGGGAIAAGGFGMAGGTAVVAATGAMLGGTLGGVISNSYFGDINGFDIRLIKKGTGPKVVLINGFLTEKNPYPSDWIPSLKVIYPNNPWYYLKWESKRLYDLGSHLGGHTTNASMANYIRMYAVQASKAAAKKVGPTAVALTLAGLVNNPWSIASAKAAKTGILLADIIARTNDKYILCGHSLGARVIYYALENLKTKETSFIDSAHLLGGAVGNQAEDWEQAVKAVKKVIHNYHSNEDRVLQLAYQFGNFFTSNPIGRSPIIINDPRIKNHDVTVFVSGHSKYKDNFHKLFPWQSCEKYQE